MRVESTNSIKCFIGRDDDNDIDSRSDHNIISSCSQSETLGEGGKHIASTLHSIIDEINTRLKEGKPIELAEYPPLFVVHFRGTHFFKQFFTSKRRRSIGHRIQAGHFKKNIYSPAVYELAHLKLGAPINTPEKKQRIYQAIKVLQKGLNELDTNKPSKPAYYSQNHFTHETLLLENYQRYINNYEEWRDESKKRKHECHEKSPSESNFYISTTDSAEHAVKYALGGKTSSATALRPCYKSIYRQPNCARHARVGYVQIFFHTLRSIKRNQPLCVRALHQSEKIQIKDRLLNEEEITFKSWMAAKHIVHSEVARFPSFNRKYNSDYHTAQYGLTEKDYKKYQKQLKKGEGSTDLLDKLAKHYAKRLEETAKRLAAKEGGYIVYVNRKGFLEEEKDGISGFDKHASFANYQPARGEDSDSEADFNEYQNVQSNDLSVLTQEIDKLSCINNDVKEWEKAFQQIGQTSPWLEQDFKALKQKATQYFFTFDLMAAGESFCHALSHQLQRIGFPDWEIYTPDMIIKCGIDEIDKNFGQYAPFITAAVPSKNEIINRLLYPGELRKEADDKMIEAIANALGLEITIIRSDGADPVIINKSASYAVSLGYEVDVCYLTLSPVSSAVGWSNRERTSNLLN